MTVESLLTWKARALAAEAELEKFKNEVHQKKVAVVYREEPKKSEKAEKILCRSEIIRLMVSHSDEGDTPDLLVSVLADYDPLKFRMYVINGGWNSEVINGKTRPLQHMEEIPIKIICSDQDRLRGDYNEVFNNYHDVNYVAPQDTFVDFSDMDDDIPF
jgi:hypothetical protein